MSRLLSAVSLALATVVAATSLAQAQQAQQSYSNSVASKCSPDAMRLCPEHALGSTEMRYCMEAKARQISRDCIIALEDDGILPRGTRNRQAKAQ
jgi:hypothetical protein